MKIAVISNVNSSVEQLKQALARAQELGCDEILCAGDVTRPYSEPKTSDVVVDMLIANHAHVVRGPKDRDVVKNKILRAQLSSESAAWLKDLPTSLRFQWEGARVGLCAKKKTSVGISPRSMNAPQMVDLVRREAVDVLLVAAVENLSASIAGKNAPSFFALKTSSSDQTFKYIACTGTLWLPGSARSTFGVLELPSKRLEVRSVDDGTVLGSMTTAAGWQLTGA